MANPDRAFGFQLLQTEGKQARVRYYPKKSGAAINVGDGVIADAAGTVTIAGEGGALLGVAMEAKASASTDDIAVCDDPEAVFIAQCDGDFQLADTFLNYNIENETSAVASPSRSGHELDVASKATTHTLQFKVLGLYEQGSNAVGSWAIVKCKINNHVLSGGFGASGI